jgi:hypothetical protein
MICTIHIILVISLRRWNKGLNRGENYVRNVEKFLEDLTHFHYLYCLCVSSHLSVARLKWLPPESLWSCICCIMAGKLGCFYMPCSLRSRQGECPCINHVVSPSQIPFVGVPWKQSSFLTHQNISESSWFRVSCSRVVEYVLYAYGLKVRSSYPDRGRDFSLCYGVQTGRSTQTPI